MTEETWIHQKSRLIDRFGQKAFTREFSLLVSIACQSVPDREMVEIVNHMIGSRKPSDPPLIKDFYEATRPFTKKKFVLGDIKPKELAQCHDCGDSGFIRLVRNETFEPWAKWETGSAPCHCESGRKVSMNKKHNLGPQFNDAWRKSYSIRPTYGGEK